MDFRDFYAGQNDDERRADRVLRILLKDAPLSEIYKLMRKGLVKVNDKKIKADYRIKQGDKISVAEFLVGDGNGISNMGNVVETVDGISNLDRGGANGNTYPNRGAALSGNEFANPNGGVGLDIKKITVFKNEHILILDKPYDIKVHGDENSLDVIVKKYYDENFKSTSLSFTPGPLHRLDRKTTGLICFSLSLHGAKWFSENIKNHSIKKIYTGVVQGNLRKAERWEDFILKDDNIENQKSKSFKTVNISKTQNNGSKSKNAVTIATPLKHGKYYFESYGKKITSEITLCEFEIETGRTHQIRSQAFAHGLPLLGDTAYGGQKITSDRDFYLHATKLIFPENEIGLPLEIVSDAKYFPSNLVWQNENEL